VLEQDGKKSADVSSPAIESLPSSPTHSSPHSAHRQLNFNESGNDRRGSVSSSSSHSSTSSRSSSSSSSPSSQSSSRSSPADTEPLNQTFLKKIDLLHQIIRITTKKRGDGIEYAQMRLASDLCTAAIKIIETKLLHHSESLPWFPTITPIEGTATVISQNRELHACIW
jgi:hypothetical protein